MSALGGGEQTAPYEAIVALAERELELAADGAYAEMAQLAAQRDQLLAILPVPAPPAARDALTRALLIQRRVTIELLRRREQVLLSARRVELQKRTARGYGGALASGRAPRVHARG